jgi:putative glutamine amidotransferase
MRPIIGITADRRDGRFRVGENYATCITKAGGVSVILPPLIGEEEKFLDICDGFLFSGGDDPVMEQWGIETHIATTRCDEQRQRFETTLLEKLRHLPDKPVFGICLGMQWMGLLAGGTLVQDLDLEFAEHHKKGTHLVSGELGSGVVHTSHHQAITETGSLEIAAVADDGIIEAVCDHDRKWYVGVQWHPERTENEVLGQGLFNSFCKAATA